MRIELDQDSHVYTVFTQIDELGRTVPGVGEITKSAGFGPVGIPQKVLKPYAERGKAVHALCEAFDRGDNLDDYDIDQSLEGYLKSYKVFMELKKPRHIEIEKIVCGEIEDVVYGGTLDRVSEIAGQLWILDIKSGREVHDETEIQLAAYRWAYPSDVMIAAVHLHGDGSFNEKFDFKKFNEHTGHDGFVGCVKIWKWRQAKKAIQDAIPEVPF